VRVFVYVTLVFPLASAPLARLALARLHPRYATWLLALAAVVLAGTSCGALGLLALSALVRIPALGHLAHLSHQVIIAGGDSTSNAIALTAGILLGAALLVTASFTITRARALAAAFTHARTLPGAASLVVTRDQAADAYTVPGRPGRIVVSTGMLEVLDGPGRRALLAHEHAHLKARHRSPPGRDSEPAGAPAGWGRRLRGRALGRRARRPLGRRPTPGRHRDCHRGDRRQAHPPAPQPRPRTRRRLQPHQRPAAR
jgi:hypothetical protein